MNPLRTRVAFFVCFLLGGFTVHVRATEMVVGSVRTVEGTAWVVRGSETIPAGVGVQLHQGDLLRTESGSLGVILRDDTQLSLGPDSEVGIDEFAFSPAESKLSLLLRILQGTLAYVSGQISRLAPEATKIETPVATIGVRGTRLALKLEPQP